MTTKLQSLFELYHTANAARQTLEDIHNGTWKGDTMAVARNLERKLKAVAIDCPEILKG